MIEGRDPHRVRMVVGTVTAQNADGTVEVNLPGDGVMRQVSAIGTPAPGARVLVFMADLEAWAIGG